MITREPIMCDCCGKEIVAQRLDDRIIIKQRRHGKDHFGIVWLTQPEKYANNGEQSTTMGVSASDHTDFTA